MSNREHEAAKQMLNLGYKSGGIKRQHNEWDFCQDVMWWNENSYPCTNLAEPGKQFCEECKRRHDRESEEAGMFIPKGFE